jgi:hypothetical protein
MGNLVSHSHVPPFLGAIVRLSQNVGEPIGHGWRYIRDPKLECDFFDQAVLTGQV